MIAMDKAVTQVVGAAIALFRANLPLYVPEIFESEDAANQAEITTWYGNPANAIKLAVGWPEKVISMPGIWTTLQPAREAQAWGTLDVGAIGVPGVHAIGLEETVQLLVAAPNQNQVLWLQQLVLWALFTQRRTLMAPPYNLETQSVAASPLAPVPDSMNDVIFPFARAWTLTGTRPISFSLPVAPAITAIDITVEVAT